MSSLRRVMTTTAPASVILIRVVVGGVFFSEGIQKFLFPNDLGVGRFVKIGIPAPEAMGSFRRHSRDRLWLANRPRSIDETGSHPTHHRYMRGSHLY